MRFFAVVGLALTSSCVVPIDDLEHKADSGGAASGGADSGAGTNSGGSSGKAGGGGGVGGSGGSAAVGGSIGGAVGGGGSPGSCDAGICAAPAPPGFSGPYAMLDADGTTPPSCSGDYPTEIQLAHANLSAPAAVCACACDATTLGCQVDQFQLYTASACGTPCSVASVSACTTLVTSTCLSPVSFNIFPKIAGGCQPVATENMPPPTWGRSLRLCGPADPGPTCGSGSCLPAPSGAFKGLCIVSQSDAMCPPSYPNASSLYGDYSDSRKCSGSCACDPSCGTFDLFPSDSCSVAPSASGPIGTCLTPLAKSFKGKVTVQPSCHVTSQTVPIGSVQEIDPITICCQ